MSKRLRGCDVNIVPCCSNVFNPSKWWKRLLQAFAKRFSAFEIILMG